MGHELADVVENETTDVLPFEANEEAYVGCTAHITRRRRGSQNESHPTCRPLHEVNVQEDGTELCTSMPESATSETDQVAINNDAYRIAVMALVFVFSLGLSVEAFKRF